MKFSQLNGTSITEAFTRFDDRNPDVYEHFKRYALNWLSTGADTISSKQIIGRIRWFIHVENYRPGEDFKINDAFTAHYARKFITDYPQYKNRIELRELRSL